MINVTARILNKKRVDVAMQRIHINVGNIPNGIIYNRPSYIYNTISYAAYDYGWLYQNGAFDYTPPTYPEYRQELDIANFSKLQHLNIHGNYERFTDTQGGQSYADGWVQDHLTGLEWCVGFFNEMTPSTWNDLIVSSPTIDYNGRVGRVASIQEILTIQNYDIGANNINYFPFNIDLTQGSYKDIASINTSITSSLKYLGIGTSRTPLMGNILYHEKSLELNKYLFTRRIEKPLTTY